MSTAEIVTNTLDKLASEINKEAKLAEQHAMQAVNHALNAGRLLTEAKEQCPHGQWLPWMAENFEGSARTAQGYMRLFEHRDALANPQRVAHLSVREALKMLAEPQAVEPIKNDTVSHLTEAPKLPEIVIPVGSVGFCEWEDGQGNRLIFEAHSFLFPDGKTIGIRTVFGMAGPSDYSGLYCEYDRRGVNAEFFSLRKMAEKYQVPLDRMIVYVSKKPTYWETMHEMDLLDAKKAKTA